MLTKILTGDVVRSQLVALLAALLAFSLGRKPRLVPAKTRALPAPVINLSINKES